MERHPQVSRRAVVTGIGAIAGAGLLADRAGASVVSSVVSGVPAAAPRRAAAGTQPMITSINYHRIAGTDFLPLLSTVGWSKAGAGLTPDTATTVVASFRPAVGEQLTDLVLFVDPAGSPVSFRLTEVSGAGATRTLASGSAAGTFGGTTLTATMSAPPEYADPETYSYVVSVDVGGGATVYGARVTSFPATTSFVFIDPVRVWDSRTPQGAVLIPGATGGGRLSSGDELTSTLDNVITRYAWGPLLNVTLDQTVGSGYLVVFGQGHLDPTPPPISNVNWYGPNQIVANLVVTRMVEEADVTIRAGGGGSTHVIVDVLGYFV